MKNAGGEVESISGFKALFTLARSELLALSVATICLLIATALNLTLPKIIGTLVDTMTQADLSSEEAGNRLDWAVVGLLLLFAGVGLATWARSYLFTLAGERIVLRLRQLLFGNLLQQPQSFFDETHSARWVARLADDTAQIQRAVTVNLSMLLRYLLGALGALALLAHLSWRLTLVMSLVVPITAGAASIYGRALRRISKGVQDELASASEVAGESLGGIQTIRSLDAAFIAEARYSHRLQSAFTQARRRAWLGATFQGGISFASYAAIGAVIWYGGHLCLQGILSIGDLTAFLLYTFTLAFSIGALSGLWEDFSRAMGATEVVFELLHQPHPQDQGELRPETCLGEVRFDEITFHYPSRPDVTVLSGLTLQLKACQVLALVGQSGSGKSTIAALLQRIYDPIEGQITLDGHALSSLDSHWLRSQLAVVSQEPLLFATSIEENLRYAQPEATQDELERACVAARAHDFIQALPEGYQTLIGERGVRLSGGQRQRIAIARALLRNPRILILDEATSALDAESEEAVRVALAQLMEGRSTLMIAHRLSTVRDAHQIAVIEHGRVLELGQHKELLDRGGRYAELVRTQLIHSAPDSASFQRALAPL